MAPIATYVFFDTETTGLPSEESNQTKITELCLIAVKRSHMVKTQPEGSPRVQQKLTLCFNPCRKIQPMSTKITGLSNELLEHETPFNNEVFQIIDSFLSRLTEPICFIAHNGMGFDYPILKRHLVDLNVNFSRDILCADSIYCFYDMDTKEDQGLGRGSSNPMRYREARRPIFYHGYPKPGISYRVGDVHQRYLELSEPAVGHRAENDCTMVLDCALFLGDRFKQWVDENHCLLSDVNPMTPGVRL